MDSSKDLDCRSMRNFHPEKSQKENKNMISKMRNAQCCLFLQTKHCTNLGWCTKLIVWYLNYGLQTPLSITILRSKEKIGIGCPFVLAAVLNCCKSIRIMVQYQSLVLSV